MHCICPSDALCLSQVKCFAVCLQHPDLIEKRRKAFADLMKQHLKDESSPMSDGVEHEDAEAQSP